MTASRNDNLKNPQRFLTGMGHKTKISSQINGNPLSSRALKFASPEDDAFGNARPVRDPPAGSESIANAMSDISIAGSDGANMRRGNDKNRAAKDDMNDDVSQVKVRLEEEKAAHEATLRELEDVRRKLANAKSELAAVQRYDTALRGSHVCVFTQDTDLRYMSLSQSLFGRSSAEILGRTDSEILNQDSAAAIIAVKREVLVKGESRNAEVSGDSGAGLHWYDLHVEPLRDKAGEVVGLTCAAVDITERKEGEAHLRLLMRELTHRSKNLLAVIQAMARQTARQGGSIATFLERFGARLQALSRSHDLLVQESWHGASLQDLVRSQLGHYLDRDHPQVSVQGPNVQLKPEAAQSLGLALHELATNAAKYGALSKPKGQVAIEWRLFPPKNGGGLEIVWHESKGPKVGEPKRRGFGSMVIEHNLSRALDAEVELSFPPEGLRCRVAVPAAQLSSGRE